MQKVRKSHTCCTYRVSSYYSCLYTSDKQSHRMTDPKTKKQNRRERRGGAARARENARAAEYTVSVRMTSAAPHDSLHMIPHAVGHLPHFRHIEKARAVHGSRDRHDFGTHRMVARSTGMLRKAAQRWHGQQRRACWWRGLHEPTRQRWQGHGRDSLFRCSRDRARLWSSPSLA